MADVYSLFWIRFFEFQAIFFLFQSTPYLVRSGYLYLDLIIRVKLLNKASVIALDLNAILWVWKGANFCRTHIAHAYFQVSIVFPFF